MSEQHVLTIDLGTSGPKAAVVSERGRVVGAARGSVRTVFGPGGAAEQDAEIIWSETLEACAGAIAAAGVASSSIVAVAASAQYSSIVPVDANGLPLHNMVLWMDQRDSPKRLRKLDGYPRLGDSPQALLRWVKIHGLPPIEAGMALMHMRWFRYAQPDVDRRTHAYLEPVDYVTMRFTGRATANQCTAFMQLLTDNRRVGTVGWNPELMALSHIDPAKLPEMVPTGSVVATVLPEVAERLGLSPTTPVLSGINDTQAGAVAAGAFAGDHAGLALGTTSVIIAALDRKKLDVINTLYTMPSPVGGNYLVSAENGVAGVAVDYFLDNVVYPDDSFVTPEEVEDRYVAFNDAATKAPLGANGVVFLPWLRGSLAPTVDGKMRGGFLNVGLDTTRNDLARAVLEGVALNLRWLRKPVEKFIDHDISHYVFYGGGARSELWSQIMADVLGAPIHQLDQAGFANSLGTAIFAFDQLGTHDAAALAADVPVKAVYEPEATAVAAYDERSKIFTEVFKKNRPIFKQLNRRSN